MFAEAHKQSTASNSAKKNFSVAGSAKATPNTARAKPTKKLVKRAGAEISDFRVPLSRHSLATLPTLPQSTASLAG